MNIMCVYIYLSLSSAIYKQRSQQSLIHFDTLSSNQTWRSTISIKSLEKIIVPHHTWRCLGPSTASTQQAGRPSDQGQAAGVEIRQGRHGDGGDADGSGEQRIPWVEETVAI